MYKNNRFSSSFISTQKHCLLPIVLIIHAHIHWNQITTCPCHYVMECILIMSVQRMLLSVCSPKFIGIKTRGGMRTALFTMFFFFHSYSVAFYRLTFRMTRTLTHTKWETHRLDVLINEMHFASIVGNNFVINISSVKCLRMKTSMFKEMKHFRPEVNVFFSILKKKC